MFLCLGANADAASLTLAWDRSTDAITAGYIVWYGPTSGSYSKWIDVGLANSHRVDGLEAGKKYFFTVQAYSKTGKRSEFALEVAEKIPAVVKPLPVQDIVIYAADVTRRVGDWQHVSDRTAADATLLRHPSSGFRRPGRALAKPGHYFEAKFRAQGGIPYRVWVRMRASDNDRFNDSVFVQFSDTVTTQGRDVYRIGSTSAIIEELRRCLKCPSSGWGWTRGAYWREDTGLVQFEKNGLHTIRVQSREDGVDIDQIVISPVKYVGRAPGSVKNDRTIVPKPAQGTLSASAAASDVDATIEAAETNDAATPDPSASSVLTASESATTPDAPGAGAMSVSATMVQDGSIDITWTPSPEAAAGYRVEVGAASGATAYSTYTMNARATFDTTGLAASVYFVRVRAVTDSGSSEPSDEVAVTAVGIAPLTTLAGLSETQCVAAPRAPRAFNALAERSTVRLGWEPGAGPLPTGGYALEVRSTDGLWTASTEPLGVTTGMTATAADGTYVLRLTTRNSCGISPWGVETTIDVGTPAAVPGLPEWLAPVLSSDMFTLFWTAPTGEEAVTRYLIEGVTPSGSLTLDTRSPLTGLSSLPFQSGEYVLTIRAGNASGFGPASTALTFRIP